ncbi:MAG: hypothetical protein IJS45_08495 [Clostridia bacterium]|nr:hypothetical protein [Clostridia bacterium]
MAFIDDVKETITKTGKTAVRKTKDLASIAKITADIEETKSLLKAVYIEIGKKYCETYDKTTAGEEFTINVATAENLKEQLEALRTERLTLIGKVRCEECGKAVDNIFVFCPFCGKKLPETAAPAEEASDAEPEENDVTDSDFEDKDGE